MKENQAIAKAGTLLCIDKGEYSDYSVIGFFVILKDFNPLKELSKHLNENPDQKQPYGFRDYSYLAFLLKQGLLMEIKYGTLFIGSYNTDDISFTPISDE